MNKLRKCVILHTKTYVSRFTVTNKRNKSARCTLDVIYIHTRLIKPGIKVKAASYVKNMLQKLCHPNLRNNFLSITCYFR